MENIKEYDLSNIPTTELEEDLKTTKHYLAMIEYDLTAVNDYYGVGDCPKAIMELSLEQEIDDIEKELFNRRKTIH